jgi:hypothetical protein
MVAWLLKFKEYFKDYADSYVLIGGESIGKCFRSLRLNKYVYWDNEIYKSGFMQYQVL